MRYVPRSPWFRAALVFPSLVAVVALLWWRGPDWDLVARAFNLVDWAWIVFAIGLNLLSVLARSLAWRLTIDQALDPPRPRFDQVFSAFSIGLLANAVLPGRIGELARVAVLRRHLPHGPGTTGTLIGTVFAHRLFDLFPALLLVAYVFSTAKIPHWAVTSLVIVLVAGVMLFTLAVASAKTETPATESRWCAAAAPTARDGPAGPRGASLAAPGCGSDRPSDRRLGPAAVRRLCRRCAPSTSTRRCRRPGSCCC